MLSKSLLKKKKNKQHNETLMSAPTSEGTQIRKSVSRPRSTAERRTPRAAASDTRGCARARRAWNVPARSEKSEKKKKKKDEEENESSLSINQMHHKIKS